LQGITVANSPGTIDSDFRGEVCVLLSNSNKVSHTIERGDRIAQLVLSEVPRMVFEEVEELHDTTRGTGGMGSTGR
jgi:dUTP pyrophosphatase